MSTIRITAKRQATLPRALCEEMGVGPGDEVQVERVTIGSETVWVLRPSHPDWSWFGAARPYARDKSHDLDAIEESVERGLGTE